MGSLLSSATDNHISIYKKEYSFIRRNYEMAEDIQSEARKRHNDDESDRSNADWSLKFKGRRQKQEQKEKQRRWGKREEHQRQEQEQEPQTVQQVGQWWQRRPPAALRGRASTWLPPLLNEWMICVRRVAEFLAIELNWRWRAMGHGNWEGRRAYLWCKLQLERQRQR